MKEITLPRHGLKMSEGTISWLIEEGDTVQKGEPLLIVETEKSTFEVEAPGDGRITQILVENDETIPVGQVLALFQEDTQTPEEKSPETQAIQTRTEKRIKASPRAKKLAKDHEVDLSLIEGSGPQGRIIHEDVQQYIEAVSDDKGEVEKQDFFPMNQIKKITGQRMEKSFSTVPHFYLGLEVEVQRIQDIREQQKNTEGSPLSYMDFLLKGVALALQAYPLLFAGWEHGQIRKHTAIHLSLATATDKGLLVPVLKDCQEKSIHEIGALRQQLVQKALQGTLTPEDQEDGTFTITNLGTQGIEEFHPIINTPQAAILAVGKVVNRLRVKDDDISITPLFKLRLACDHRIIDGLDGANFLTHLKNSLENPISLL